MFKFEYLLLLSSVAIPAFSLPTNSARQLAGTARQAPTIPWAVTAYSTSCSPGGCTYSLSVTNANSTAAYNNEPIFTASCTGVELVLANDATSAQGTLISCDNETVLSSQTYNGTSRMVTVNVRHAFTIKEANSLWSNSVQITGFNSYSTDLTKPVAFAVTPSEITAVG